jgi:sugar O-acyltransferase (sialic acid O-acetyltransferase NeuD family)
MSRKVVIFGTGEFATVARVYFDEDSLFEVVAFTVHAEYVTETELEGLPVVPFEELPARYPPDECAMFVAIGFSRVNRARAEVFRLCKDHGYELVSYVCSKATVWSDLDVGENTFVFENNVIQPFVRIGDNVVLWSGNHVGHHAEIGDHCFITSHVVISGGVRVGAYCFIGVNATLRDHITIGPSTVIGAGALVMKDTEADSVYVEPRTKASERRASELDL